MESPIVIERNLGRLRAMLTDARKQLAEWESVAFGGDPRRRRSDIGCMATRDLIRRIDEDSATWPNVSDQATASARRG
jgi:hypothetical protein